jgi:hypothetical protein
MIIGAGGCVGIATLESLLLRGSDQLNIQCGVRDIKKFQKHMIDVPTVQMDMANKAQMTESLKGVDRVFIVVPSSQDRTLLAMNALDAAKEKYYSPDYVLERLVTKQYGFIQFDPLAAAEIVGQDITGEFDIHWEGRKLEGMSTPKQIELLNRYGIAGPEKLTKAQASVLIGSLMEKFPPANGEATDAQIWKLKQYGYDAHGMRKAQASMLISQVIQARDALDKKKTFAFEF